MNANDFSSDWENQLRLLQPAQPTTSEAEAMYAMGFAAGQAEYQSQKCVSVQAFRMMSAAMLAGMLFAGVGGFWLRDIVLSDPSSRIAQSDANDQVVVADPVKDEVPAERSNLSGSEREVTTTAALPQASTDQWFLSAFNRWWLPGSLSTDWGNSVTAVESGEPSDLTVFISRQHFVHLIMEPHTGYRRTSPVMLRGKSNSMDGAMDMASDSQSSAGPAQPSYLTPATLGRNSALWKDWIQ
jgi:hypothetical protein